MWKVAAFLSAGLIISASQGVTGATRYVSESVSEPGDGTSWQTAFATIQEGIDASSDGDTVIVAPGTYVENIHFNGKNIVLRSTDPSDPAVVEQTIIDGNQSGPVVTFSGAEDATCVLSGFTIQNGMANEGAGVLGGTRDQHTHATIQNNTIKSNSASYRGGGLAYCDGVIGSNTISDNSAGSGSGGGLIACNGPILGNSISRNTSGYSGGALAGCNGTIKGNTISRNTSDYSGGGLAGCSGVIEGNTIQANSAMGRPHLHRTADGGGLADCEGTIQNNVICDNFAADGGGGLARCGPWIQDNLISGNSAYLGGGLSRCDANILRNRIIQNVAYDGGGLYDCDAEVKNNVICGNRAIHLGGGLYYSGKKFRNNTICGNSAHEGGGIADGAARNCIIWLNTAVVAPQFSGLHEGWLDHSCVQDWTEGGEGNIAEDPRFVDPDGPDDDPETYEDNDYRLLPDSPCVDAGINQHTPGLDMDGNLRIAFGRESLTVDMGAYEYNSMPFAIRRVLRLPGQSLVLTWNSQPTDTYTVWSCDDLLAASWAEETDSPIPSQGATTKYKLSIPPDRVKFYRVKMSP